MGIEQSVQREYPDQQKEVEGNGTLRPRLIKGVMVFVAGVLLVAGAVGIGGTLVGTQELMRNDPRTNSITFEEGAYPNVTFHDGYISVLPIDTADADPEVVGLVIGGHRVSPNTTNYLEVAQTILEQGASEVRILDLPGNTVDPNTRGDGLELDFNEWGLARQADFTSRQIQELLQESNRVIIYAESMGANALISALRDPALLGFLDQNSEKEFEIILSSPLNDILDTVRSTGEQRYPGIGGSFANSSIALYQLRTGVPLSEINEANQAQSIEDVLNTGVQLEITVVSCSGDRTNPPDTTERFFDLLEALFQSQSLELFDGSGLLTLIKVEVPTPEGKHVCVFGPMVGPTITSPGREPYTIDLDGFRALLNLR